MSRMGHRGVGVVEEHVQFHPLPLSMWVKSVVRHVKSHLWKVIHVTKDLPFSEVPVRETQVEV